MGGLTAFNGLVDIFWHHGKSRNFGNRKQDDKIRRSKRCSLPKVRSIDDRNPPGQDLQMRKRHKEPVLKTSAALGPGSAGLYSESGGYQGFDRGDQTLVRVSASGLLVVLQLRFSLSSPAVYGG